MRHELNLWVAGGDMRQAKLAELLAADGHTVHSYALERMGPLDGVMAERTLSQAALADCVILPLPVADGAALHAPLAEEEHPLTQVLDALRPGQVVCAGRVTPEVEELAKSRGLQLYDYFAREELAVANAVPTAEGAIQIAMEELPITIHGARVLVIGCGRLGRALAWRLAGLGAKLSLAARSYADLAWIESCGYGVEHTGQLQGWLCSYDLVINTVPAQVLGQEELRDLKEGCLVIDLASKPGGADGGKGREKSVILILHSG
ncbi:dipicolinate synthase subunit DpsA [Flavonifractor hominis]|uniref:Dipicolinate synthase subunit DpsA n=1 Tax=Flavonifractor hominis TaxID=3133178 RepID=A0ABV1EQE9_9FIRM